MLDKAINSGKEKRRQFYGAKSYCRSCRNHGSCSYCESNRLHKNQVRRRDADEQIKEFFEE